MLAPGCVCDHEWRYFTVKVRIKENGMFETAGARLLVCRGSHIKASFLQEGLKQFNRVSRRVIDYNVLTTNSCNDIIWKLTPFYKHKRRKSR